MSWMDTYEQAASTGFQQGPHNSLLCGCDMCHYGLPQVALSSPWAALMRDLEQVRAVIA